MVYVFDTSSLIVIGHYFPDTFPSFWNAFDQYVADERIISVREVRRELSTRATNSSLQEWVDRNRHIFLLPQPEETVFVAKIFENPHFQALVAKKNLTKGAPVADPFLVASAKSRKGCVVTEEKKKPNGSKIPNVCEHYDVECVNLEGFMRMEGWQF